MSKQKTNSSAGCQHVGPSRIKVLIVDDDRKLCRLVQNYLEPMGYEVVAAHDGAAALSMILDNDFHAVILDVMLPEMDGFEVLKRLRRESEIPVLMLTARGEETDRIVGLEMGADDYLPKTFSTRELLARLRAVTRRCFQSDHSPVANLAEADIIKHEELLINRGARTVHMDKQPLRLTPLEFDLLLHLATAAGRVFTRDQLLDAITGRSYDAFDRSIDVHISSLRRKLGDDPRNPRLIQTVRSIGYMFKKTGRQK
jgi:two-component system response regulator CpxR